MSVTVELMNVSSESAVPSQVEFEGWSEAVLKELNQSEQSI